MMDEAIEATGVKPKIKIVIGEKEGWTSYSELDKESGDAEAAKTKPNDLLFCFFTSGTTGLPKKVGHTAASYPIGHLSTAVMAGIRPDDIHHNLSAPGWAKWAWSSFFAPPECRGHGHRFQFHGPRRQSVSQDRRRLQSHHLLCPAHSLAHVHQPGYGSIRPVRPAQSISAGEPLNPEVITQWKKYTGTEIRDFYGQTESTAMIGNPPWMTGKMRSGSFGYPSYMYDVVLVDDEGNEVTTPDEPGHICVRLDRWRALGLFTEYIGSPEKMAERLRRQLLLHRRPRLL
jgi:4-hydroxybutyrate---CoA ligase (AMP-forming)